MDTVIPAMKTVKNFNPQQPFNIKTGFSAEVSVTSISIESQRPAQDAYRPSQAPSGGCDCGTYSPGAAYGPRQSANRLSLVLDRAFNLDVLFANQRNPQLSQSEAYHKIEISITKIQISIGGCTSAEPAWKTRELGTAYNVTAILEQEKGEEFQAKINELHAEYWDLPKVWAANTQDQADPAARQQLDDARIAWATELMESDPAGFRAWLQIHVGPQAMNGNFDNCVKPEGFTLEDYNTWMSRSFAEYESGAVPTAEDVLGME